MCEITVSEITVFAHLFMPSKMKKENSARSDEEMIE